jgi:gliding motility-associated-like protein
LRLTLSNWGKTFFLLALNLISLFCIAQADNSCGVIASFTPGTDSVINTTGSFTLTSTSTNTTSVQWFVNKFFYSSQTTLTDWFYTTGYYEIMLVASNGACSDTAYATYFRPGTPHPIDSLMWSTYGFPQTMETGSCIDDTPDGGFIMGGTSTSYGYPFYDRAYLVKAKRGGCIEWSKIINEQYGGFVSSVLGCRDSSILVGVGFSSGQNLLYHLDKNGALLWKKNYSTSYFEKIIEDGNGNFYTVTRGYNGMIVLKLNNSGSIIWNKYYSASREASIDISGKGLVFLQNHLYIAGYSAVYSYGSGDYTRKNFLLKLDPANGQTLWAKEYSIEDGQTGFVSASNYDTLIMVSAAGKLNGDPRIGHSLVFIDPEGNFNKGIHLTHQSNEKSSITSYFNALNCYAESDTAKNIYLLQYANQPISLQPGFILLSYLLKMDTASHLNWGMGYAYSTRGQLVQPALNKYNEWAAVGYENELVGSASYPYRNFTLFKVSTPPSSLNMDCDFRYNGFNFYSTQYTRQDFSLVSDSTLTMQESISDFPLSTVYSESRYLCPAFIDSCSMMNLTGPSTICRLSNVYTYRAARNKKCVMPVKWETEGPLTVISQSDSAITVQFQSPGNYKISASLLSSCYPKKDSVMVLVKPARPPVKLGSDTSLCPGNSLVLRAGPEFISYAWQDGTTDSVLTASAPGLYWVSVSDSCGNTSSDTIRIQATASIPVSIGPDRSKCNQDTLHLNAPVGFLNYSWSNNYTISSLSTQTITVNPSTNTDYYLKAEKTSGCFAFDTIRITVYQSPPVDLGLDLSICSGDSAVIAARDGFARYQWSNGENANRLTVKTAGSYSVVATTFEGCKSFDTVKLVNVFPNPVVRLDHNNSLCTGASRLLDAGPFSSFRWNVGSTGQTISINKMGTYAVEVMDHNGCRGTDTTVITTLLPLPIQFLPSDTAICSYGSLTLKANTAYKTYLWSTNALGSSITINQPGLYWLQVKDGNDCEGKDSIVVSPKECMKGLYVPTAFSPNGDRKNEVFRPMLFGNVKHYQFTVYNRWGQVIYQTTEPGKGWNGSYGGSTQDSNVFVWTCSYQLEGDALKTERGTVLLIR